MQDVFEKIIEKLEEIRIKKTCNTEKCNTKELCRICVVDDAIEIVKQEAEQYEECYKDCGDCEAYNKERHHCPKFCKVITEAVKEIEENHNGWIPCSERMPEKYNRVLAHTDAGGYYIAHVNGCGKFVCTAECVSTVIENSDVIAWQPLPDPYQPVSNDSTDAGTRYEKSAWRDLILRNFMRGSDA